MTVSRGFREATQKVSDMVRGLIPHLRNRQSPEEIELAAHLRGNERLFLALKGIIESRIAGRAVLPEPTDPLVCKSMLARDRELQWFLYRLEAAYRAPVLQPEDNNVEQPA